MNKLAPYQIPISEFEKGLQEENKKEIFELFTNHNEIKSEEEFNEIQSLLQRACFRGDLKLLEIYLNENVKLSTESGYFSFKINKTNKTASLFQLFEKCDKIIIPRTIEYDGIAYLVTSIINSSHNAGKKIKCIEFPSNSAVQTIYEESFSHSPIETISFPSSLIELKDGWCRYANHLKKIIVSESNNLFVFKEGKYLLGKSDMKNEEFDILLFASRDIEEAIIPSNIKIISSFAFDHCEHLSKVEFTANSNLQSIGKYAFSETKITEISVPSSVSTICENAFNNSTLLSKVEFAPNSNLQTIGKSAFLYTNIKQVLIPSSVLTIDASAFMYCDRLSKVEFAPNSNLQTIGECAFLDAKITQICIPSSVKMIYKSAFLCCSKLSKVEFAPNSNLQAIGEGAFSYTKIAQILIPSSVSTIGESAFENCKNLQICEISEESKLHSLNTNIFKLSEQVIIMIPQKIRKMINLTTGDQFN